MIDAGDTGSARGGTPPGVRELSAVGGEEASAYGPEVRAFVRLIGVGLPVAPSWLVRLADDPAGRIARAVELALARGQVARLRPALPSQESAGRCDRLIGVPRDVVKGDDVGAHVDELVRGLRETFGSGVLAVAVRVVACDPHPCGSATSADTSRGDPDELAVWTREEPAARWLIDRRNMWPTQQGGGLPAAQVSSLADLADRVQLVLGRPVEVEWCSMEGQLALAGLRFLDLPPTIGIGAWRRVALVAADEGTVATLTVDALDSALGGDGGSQPAVKRVFARPYRRMDGGVQRFRHAMGGAASLGRAGARAARVITDVASPLTAARRFHGAMSERLSVLDAAPLHALDDRLLVEAIEERHALVSDAFRLLDHGREATGAVLTALEAAVGPLGRDTILTLAAPRPTRWRLGIDARLRRLGRQVRAAHGRLVSGADLSGQLGRAWRGLRTELADVRPIGIDVAPDAIGASDADLKRAMLRALDHDVFPSEAARRAAAQRVRARLRGRPLGRTRETMAASLVLLIRRVAGAKGAIADDLAAVLLRLRRAAVVAGQRLVDRGVLEAAEDALQLQLVEIRDALAREPGAYAARARLRREDDARWAEFEAPRRLEGRTT